MDALMEILTGLRPDIDFDTEAQLVDGGVLDSFDIISLVGEINDAFDVEITVEHLQPENFNSAKAIMALIERLQGEE